MTDAITLRVLNVDDEPLMSRVLERVLMSLLTDDWTEIELEFTTLSNGRNALAWIAENEVDLIISDIDMPLMDGVQFHREASAMLGADLPEFIFWSAKGTEAAKAYAQMRELQIVKKGSEISNFVEVLERVIRRYHL